MGEEVTVAQGVPAAVVDAVATPADREVEQLAHLPSFPGKQLLQTLPAFAQAQRSQVPVLLQRQHTMVAGSDKGMWQSL